MSEFAAVPAVREAVRLLIGFAGGTGSGKTYSALRVAGGITHGEPFCLIDTENGRALQYADEFRFDHVRLEPPFTPARYLAAIQANAHYPALVVDSASHEWAGIGGVLDMADAELERMGGRDAAKMASWVKPKAEHKRFVHDGLLRLNAHVILCFRAEPKVEMRRVEREGRQSWEIIPKPALTGLDGWIPIAEKMLPYELTVSFLLMADNPGVPRPIKLPDRLRAFVPLDSPLSEDTGASLAKWADGKNAPVPSDKPDSQPAANRTPPKGPELLADVIAEIRAAYEELSPPRDQIYARLCEFRNEVPARDVPEWDEIQRTLSLEDAQFLRDRLSAYRERLSEVTA